MTTSPMPDTRAASNGSTPPANTIFVQWQGGRNFDIGRQGGPVARVDGDAATGPSPVDTLLGALATCASVDVVDILAKRRTPVATFEVEVDAQRANGVPRRVTHVLLKFRITGEGIERDQAERAIDLSINKYCSVRDSLDPDLPIEWTLALNDSPKLRTTG
ncbi:MAG TPA: OsmC family protein [Gemmatimonadaceae bacterium]|jgi:putative redox protein|nr:OsmC family protein [Gemmatimonadaceae bacterium]